MKFKNTIFSRGTVLSGSITAWRHVTVAVALAACFSSASAYAAILQWDGNATTAGISDATNAWNTANNWQNAGNVNWTQNSDAQFGTGTLGNAGNVTIAGTDPIVNSITFNAPFGTGNFNITGGTVNLLNASTDITANAGDHTITSGLAGIGSGLNKKGNAQVRLSGAISYTGATTISAGTLRVNSGANSLYTNTSEFFMSGGSLVVSATATQSINKNFTFTSASGSITTFDGVGATGHTLSGLMTINSGAVMSVRPRNTNAGAALINFDITGKITGGGDLAVAGNGSDGAAAAFRVSNTTNDYAGSTTISAGRLVLGNSEVIPNGSNVTMNTIGAIIPSLDLNGKNETIAGLSSTASGALIFNNSGAGTSVLTVGSSNATASFAGVIKDDDGSAGGIVALTKIGTGTQTLSGTNSYTGATSVIGGTGSTLLVNGSIAGSGATVSGGATLGGTGAINTAVTINNGTLSPGASIETLATGALTFNNTSTFLYDLNSTALNGDLVVANGLFDINATSTLMLTDASPGTLPFGSKLTLVNYSGTWNSGTFNGYADGSTFLLGANTWRINYDDTAGGTNFSGEQGAVGFDNYLTITVVPEPSSLAMLLFGSLLLLCVGRKRVS